eukprot:3568141-Lingulodinium_polyedra.AAC.1
MFPWTLVSVWRALSPSLKLAAAVVTVAVLGHYLRGRECHRRSSRRRSGALSMCCHCYHGANYGKCFGYLCLLWFTAVA